MATKQSPRAHVRSSAPRATFGQCSDGAPSALRSFTAALRAIAAPAFLVRPDGAVEQANETGARELQARGPSLLRAIEAARNAVASGLRSPRLDDGAELDICVVRQHDAPPYALAVLRAPAGGC